MKVLFRKNIARVKNGERGTVLIIVMSFIFLMVLSTVTLSTVVQRDVKLVERILKAEQAEYMAEAGINHALAEIMENGFASRTSFTGGSLDTGSYSVSYCTSGGRHLISSTGTAGGMSALSRVEVKDNTPTALNYFSGAGNDIRIYSFVADAEISGDLHANNNIYLMAGPIVAWLHITGDVSATGIVKEGTRHDTGSWDWLDDHVEINGSANDTAAVNEGADRITFPTFDYTAYRNLAEDSGDYYDTDTEFNGQALTPGNGIVYVNGEARFRGPCSVTGGIIADRITIIGTLSQFKSGTRNVVIARNGDIGIFGRLYVQEALVMASRDITSLQLLADIDINGIMLAKRDIDMWNFLTYVDYTYAYISPSDMMVEGGADIFELVSWNR